MKKYIVVGNPIDHSFSPKLHNFWFKKNNINAVYEKKKLENNEIENLIIDLKKENINGINVTVPFKKEVIPYLDKLSIEASKTQSVNTIYLEGDKAVGHNTDIEGFELAIKNLKMNFKNKTVLLLGAGGVVPSLIFSLLEMKVSEIFLSNRTKTKADQLKKLFRNIEVINWGKIPDVDVIINATSLGLNNDDKFNLNFSKIKNKLFYDVIYNPKETEFLKNGKKLGNITENGKMMFIYQAQLAFKIWHNILPEIDEEIVKLLD
jgi:shikimate dehydrogenase